VLNVEAMDPVERLVQLLREEEDYLLLRNPDVVGHLAKGGDVDLLAKDVPAFARKLVVRLGPPLMIMQRSYVLGLFWRWGHIDLLPAIEWHGAAYLSSEDIFASANRNGHGFLEASLPLQAVVCWFSSLIWGGFFKERYRSLIVQAANECGEAFYKALEYAVGPRWAKILFEMAQMGTPEASVKWVKPLRRALWWRAFRRAPFATLRSWASFWIKELGLRLRPPAPWVAVLGLDGSGKSTVLKALGERLGHHRPLGDLWLGHWRPNRLMPSQSSGPVLDPHGKPPRGFLPSVGKLGLLLADWVVGYWLDIVHARAKGRLVAFDRHFVDLWVDPRRYRYGGPMGLARFVGRLVPKPDLFIVLDLPAEVAHARKPEVPLEEARRLRERYLALARSLPNAHVVDASRPLEDVVAEVEEILLSYLSSRAAQRLRAWGLLDSGGRR